MTDDDLDLDVEETPDEPTESSAPSGDLPDWARKEVEKARREAAKYRSQLRRTELAKEFGDDVLELVPETLKLDEQKALAAKLAERLRSEPEPTLTESVEQPEPPKVEVPEGLAAVARSSAQGTAPPSPTELSYKEIVAIGKTNPAEARRLIKAQFPDQ